MRMRTSSRSALPTALKYFKKAQCGATDVLPSLFLSSWSSVLPFLWEQTQSPEAKMIHRSFMPDVLSYNSALHGCARTGQWQQALLLFDQILAHGLVPSAWGPPKGIQVGDVFVGGKYGW